MRKLSLLILLLASWVGCFAQIQPLNFDENGGFSRVIETNANAKQIFQYCRAFLFNNIKNYKEAVLIEDSNANRIKINYCFRFLEDAQPLASQKAYIDAYELSKLTVDCKDNKFRVMVEDPVFNYKLYGANMLIDSRTDAEYWLIKGLVLSQEHFRETRSDEYLRIILHMKDYIEQQIKNEDW